MIHHQGRSWGASLLAAVILVLWTGTGLTADPHTLPWKALEDEAVSLLSRYIQIDTTNPPGNEIKAARFFKEILDREGIEARIIESAPGRGNLYARLRGNGSKKAWSCSITWTWSRPMQSFGKSHRLAGWSKTGRFGGVARWMTKVRRSWSS